MALNACQAIPEAPAEALSANQIFWAQEKPRLPMRSIEEMCEAAAQRGDVEVVQTGQLRRYRWTPVVSNAEPMSACPHGVPHRWPCDECGSNAGNERPSGPAR